MSGFTPLRCIHVATSATIDKRPYHNPVTHTTKHAVKAGTHTENNEVTAIFTTRSSASSTINHRTSPSLPPSLTLHILPHNMALQQSKNQQNPTLFTSEIPSDRKLTPTRFAPPPLTPILDSNTWPGDVATLRPSPYDCNLFRCCSPRDHENP